MSAATSQAQAKDDSAQDLTATILRTMREDWALHVMPTLQGAALEHAEYARQMLGRLCTDRSGQAADAALRRDTAALFAALDRYLDSAPLSGTLDAGVTPAELQQALAKRLRLLTAVEASDTLWQQAATLGMQLRTAVEAQQLPAHAQRGSATPGISAEALQDYLREQWPEFPCLEVPVLEILPGGRSKTTMFARVAGHPTLETFALRQDVPNGMIDTADGSTRVADEYPLLCAAFAAGLPVAEPVWLEAHDNALGAPFMITRKCAGQAPGTWRGFHAPHDPQTRSAVLHFAEVLAALHQLPLHATGLPLPLSTEAGMQREIAYRRDKWQREALAAFPLIDCALERLHRECRNGLGAPVLVHGDVLPHNLLVENGRITALLDWEFAHPGDPAEDLAYCRAAVEAVLPWADFLAHYHAAGGPVVNARRLAIYGLFGLVRNSTLLASAARMHADGLIDDFTTGAIGYLSLPMMEMLIGQQLQILDTLTPDDEGSPCP